MRKNLTRILGTAVAVLSLSLPVVASAQPTEPDAKDAPPASAHGFIVRDVHEAAALGDSEAKQLLESGEAAKGAGCSWWEPCGVVHNRTGFPLYLSRDSAAHATCQPRGPYNWLPSGSNSNTRFPWPDTDCFTGGNSWVYYLGVWRAPWTWVRIWSHVWVY